MELEVPVIPTYLEGVGRILPKGRTVRRHGHVAIASGEPVKFAAGTPYADAARALEHAVKSLQQSGTAEPTRVEV